MASDDQSRFVLSNREFNTTEPLSVATGLAIDSSLGRLEEAKDKHPPVLDYNLLYVHIRTLYRNILGSVPTESRIDLTPYTIAEAMATEMRVIETIVSEISEGKCNVEFYHCSYKSIMSDFPKSLPRIIRTPNQQAAAALERSTYTAFKEEIESKPPVDYYNRKFDDKGGDCLLFTHYPVDLFNRYRFRNVNLLESHTGAIKPPSVWNTKLKDGWGLEALPFDSFTLQMFGDNIHFSPMNKKVRMVVYNLAVKNRWNHATTKDYVLHTIKNHRDPALEALAIDLYRN